MLRRLEEEPAHLQVDPALIANGNVVLAEADGVVIGFASFVIAGNDHAELEGMFITPAYWRRGIATDLFLAVEQELVRRQITVIRVVAGDSAVPFYRSVGFVIVGEEQTPLGPVVPMMEKALLFE
ncbi:GNAT family N-acetyltransferase [Pelagibacterium sp. H642]|uniref:GNAT family N-acetyltransferase n=1 Tax=Pelagibacterium sp. H642 TaxID=1881069 RepID=UPI0028159FCC|nr:GNAT family N-acetyltransferase [Pelagibacterium sp. H642]WMT92636.1 GNAT family N-acetyltransferase [Pelagibacterium sp. H642]